MIKYSYEIKRAAVVLGLAVLGAGCVCGRRLTQAELAECHRQAVCDAERTKPYPGQRCRVVYPLIGWSLRTKPKQILTNPRSEPIPIIPKPEQQEPLKLPKIVSN